MSIPHFHVDEIAILCNIPEPWAYKNGIEVRIVEELGIREVWIDYPVLHLPVLCYVIQNPSKPEPTHIEPQYLRKKFEPGDGWSVLREKLNDRPRVKELTELFSMDALVDAGVIDPDAKLIDITAVPEEHDA